MRYDNVIHIGGRDISIDAPTYFIADIASSHCRLSNGKLTSNFNRSINRIENLNKLKLLIGTKQKEVFLQ